jgi:ADP-ribose pyrophosphatase
MSEDVIDSKQIYRGRVINVRVDTVRMANGRTASRDVVEHAGAVAIVPVTDEGHIVFVRQFRLPAAKNLLEIPAGSLDPGEVPDEAAQRELREETGQRAATLRRLTGFYTAPGYSSEYIHVYVAEGLSEDRLEADEDEDLAVELRTLPEALELIDSGAIEDAKTIVGLLAYARERKA